MTTKDEKALAPYKELPVAYPPGPAPVGIVQRGDAFAGASEKRATEKQTAILCAPVDPKDAKILPDTGSLYLSWDWYANRLTQAFGPMGWSLLPAVDAQNNPIPPYIKGEVAYREFFLKVEGRFVASALGECAYRENNHRMTWGDAVEGARSNALARCCKGLGMASVLFDDEWREKWKAEYAIAVNGRNGILWRKKITAPFRDEKGHAHEICPCVECGELRKRGSATANNEPLRKPKTVDADTMTVAHILSVVKSDSARAFYTIVFQPVGTKADQCTTYSESHADIALSCKNGNQVARLTLSRQPAGHFGLKGIEPHVEKS